MAAGGGGFFGGPVSNSLVAFALPDVPRKPLPSAVTAAVAAAKTRRGTPQPGDAKPLTLPPGTAKALVERTCNTSCHSIEVVATQRMNRAEWDSVVRSMVARGARASDEEVKTIVDYLARTLGR
jgi:cytochrome c5